MLSDIRVAVEMESVKKPRLNDVMDHADSDEVTFIFPRDNNAKVVVKKNQLKLNSVCSRIQFNSGQETDTIIITDISRHIFQDIIDHYKGTKRITVTEKNFLEIFYMCRKYFLVDLTNKVFFFIYGFVKPQNLTLYYDELQKYDDMTFIEDVVKNICVRHPLSVILTLRITSASHLKILEIILKSDVLKCTSEYGLYCGIVDMMMRTRGQLDWEEAVQRLGNLKYFIRYPTMTVSEVIKCGKYPSILTQSEGFDILLWIQEKFYTETLSTFSMVPRYRLP
ncbi:hypothetical protein DMENIID0001_057510 [Sergentomyia squamirostris]